MVENGVEVVEYDESGQGYITVYPYTVTTHLPGSGQVFEILRHRNERMARESAITAARHGLVVVMSGPNGTERFVPRQCPNCGE